jgi:hypothetical protein
MELLISNTSRSFSPYSSILVASPERETSKSGQRDREPVRNIVKAKRIIIGQRVWLMSLIEIVDRRNVVRSKMRL